MNARCDSAVPGWKHEADFWLVQASFDVGRLVEWRRSLDYDGKVFAGVLVMASAKMAARIAASLPEIDVPADLISALEHDPDAGVQRALDPLSELRRADAFDGVHLVPVGRYNQVAALMRNQSPGEPGASGE
jgi:5,10-methylenetetrahydrofolate reductase